MVKNSLGLIEVVGLAAGMEAADVAVKAANVELLGYELTKGGGLVVIKLCGDVGAVKAAVEAGAAAAAKINKVYATHVIPRPHSELGGIIVTKETAGRKTVCSQPAPQATVIEAAKQPADIPVQAGQAVVTEPAAVAPEVVSDIVNEKPVPAVSAGEVCNLCGDPACGRKKGDPRITCIHFDKHNKEDE
ncbi:hypothetical protein SCACP_07710 [Sporomusa carbonis]|uniref:BMC domain-containing protein n=1 Tax=Sporomusa carbonis TaxID=3076075 RepID=UPI003A71C24C